MTCQWAQLLKGNYEAVLALREKVIQAHQKAFFLRSYVMSFCAVSHAYAYMGQWDAAVKEGERALKAADAHSDPSFSSFSAMFISIAYGLKGDMVRAIELAQLSVVKASSPLDYLWARSAMGWALCRSGEPEKGLDYLVEAVTGFRMVGAHAFSVSFGTTLADGYWRNHQFDKAQQELEEVSKLAEKMRMKWHLAACHLILGAISLEADPAQEKEPSADTCFEKAIAIFSEIKAENHLALAYAGLGRCYGNKGDVAKARDYLNRALEIFKRLGTLLEPDRVREELAKLPET
jgi:tetratricopeptide (TPR) repeat protein